MRVEKRDKNDAEELIDRIQSNISNFGRLVTINSLIEVKEESFFSRLISDIPIELDRSNIDIDLNINIPQGVDLEVINSFGDIVIIDFEGKLRCELKHGDIDVNQDVKTLDLDHSYGRVDMKSAGLAKMNLRNSRLKAETFKDLQVNSHGSELEIEEIGYLNIESNKDELRIISADKVRGEMKFGDALLDELGEELDLDIRVSDLRISSIKSPKPILYIDQSNSDIDISISNTSFNLKADLEDGVLRLPDSFKNVNSNILDKKDNKRIITGNYGEVSTGDFELIGKKGYVILREI